MLGIARQAAVPAALLCIAALGAGCAQLAGIEETTCSVRHAYACKCACTGGGETFSLNNNVCLPESLNPVPPRKLLHASDPNGWCPWMLGPDCSNGQPVQGEPGTG
jgi:hypothetical protein